MLCRTQRFAIVRNVHTRGWDDLPRSCGRRAAHVAALVTPPPSHGARVEGILLSSSKQDLAVRRWVGARCSRLTCSPSPSMSSCRIFRIWWGIVVSPLLQILGGSFWLSIRFAAPLAVDLLCATQPNTPALLSSPALTDCAVSVRMHVRTSSLSYASDRLYLEGGSAGVTCEDVVNKKTLPQALQEELLRSRGQDVVSAERRRYTNPNRVYRRRGG